jgi:hypothetical protein
VKTINGFLTEYPLVKAVMGSGPGWYQRFWNGGYTYGIITYSQYIAPGLGILIDEILNTPWIIAEGESPDYNLPTALKLRVYSNDRKLREKFRFWKPRISAW